MGEEQVILGTCKVIGTRYPALSVDVMRFGKSRAMATKGRCPLEHKGELLHDFRPKGADFTYETAEFMSQGAEFRLRRIYRIFNYD